MKTTIFELLTNKELEKIMEEEPLDSNLIGEAFAVLVERKEDLE